MNGCSPDHRPPCCRCTCSEHQEMYEESGRWFCTFHLRTNESTPVPTSSTIVKDDWEPALGLEIFIYLLTIAVIVVMIKSIVWLLGG